MGLVAQTIVLDRKLFMKSYDFYAWQFWYIKGNKHFDKRDWESAIDSYN